MKQKILDHFAGNFLPFAERYFPDGKLSGDEYRTLCPFHDDHDPSLDFNIKKGVCLCRTCNEDGSIFDLYMKQHGVNFSASLKGIATDFNIPLNGIEAKGTNKIKVTITKNTYVDENGNPILQVRRREPGIKGKKKSFTQWSWRTNGRGGWKKGANGLGRMLYRLSDIIKAVEILIFEGEKDAYKAAKLGFESTTVSGGAGGDFPDGLFKPLYGKDVAIFPDNDLAGENDTLRKAIRLIGKVRSLKIVHLPNLKNKGDLSDFLKDCEDNGKSPDDAKKQIEKLIKNTKPLTYKKLETLFKDWAKKEVEREAAKEKEPTTVEILIKIIRSVKIVRSDGDEIYALIEKKTSGAVEVLPIVGKDFKNWLNYKFLAIEGRTPSPTAISSMISATTGRVRLRGQKQRIYQRIAAEGENKVYIDQCDDKWQMVEVTPDGWSILPGTGLFKRNANMMAIPTPQKSGNIEALRPLVNMTNDDFVLFVAWMVAALCPWGPYAILFLTGTEGSAKTTIANIARMLVDPAYVLSSSPPRDEKDLVVIAKANRIISLDNISYIPNWLSDALCRIATGGGYMARQLYTDDGLAIFKHKQPIILNSIGDAIVNNDLADRSISLFLPQVSENDRKTEKEITAEFAKVLPEVFGGLMTAVSTALSRLPDVKLNSLPRMADFAKLIVAAEPSLPWPEGRFMEVYNSNREEMVTRSVEANPLTAAIREWIQNSGRTRWEGTAKQLLNELKPYSGGRTDSKNWPASPEAVGKKLRKLVGFLKRAGVDIDFYQETSSKRDRFILIEYHEK